MARIERWMVELVERKGWLDGANGQPTPDTVRLNEIVECNLPPLGAVSDGQWTRLRRALRRGWREGRDHARSERALTNRETE